MQALKIEFEAAEERFLRQAIEIAETVAESLTIAEP